MRRKFFAVLTALAAVIGVSVLITAKRRKELYDKERVRQAEEYNSAITKALTDEDLCDFNDFAAALNECYGITAKCVDGETVEYSSDKYSAVLTSNDIIRTRNGTLIQLERMSQLKCFFLPN